MILQASEYHTILYKLSKFNKKNQNFNINFTTIKVGNRSQLSKLGTIPNFPIGEWHTFYNLANRPQQHLFVIRSIIARYRQLDKVLWLNLYDLSAFFDKESLRDIMNTLFEIEIEPKAYRTFYLLNKRTNIKIKTGCGMTDGEDVGEIIGQGSGGAALVSQVNLDHGVNDMFCGSTDEVYYGTVRVQPVIFQDDILRLGDSLPSVIAGNVKMDAIMNQKKLKFNADKTGFIMMVSETKINRY